MWYKTGAGEHDMQLHETQLPKGSAVRHLELNLKAIDPYILPFIQPPQSS